MERHIISHGGLRILCLAEIRGHLSLLNELAQEYQADIIVHTGSFGFFDEQSVNKIHESYLRHIVAFSGLLEQDLVDKISELSRANGEYVDHDVHALRQLLDGRKISEIMDFVRGEKTLDVPVYTIYGMVEDSTVLNKFRLGAYSIPNLCILDENTTATIKLDSELDLLLCGIGGSLSYQKLFHHGTFDNDLNKLIKPEQKHTFTPVAGDPGNVWITMVQIGEFIRSVEGKSKKSQIKIMLTHPSPSREGLLAHLSVFLKIDYTISNGLHFLYPSSFNELSICPNFEFYKLKFSDARSQLSSIWVQVQPTIEKIVETEPRLQDLLSIALTCFDRIPVINSKDQDITPLALSFNKRDVNSNTIRLQSDMYYLAFQNQWHFNLCDVNVGSVVLGYQDGKMSFEAMSKGFDFTFKRDGQEIRERRNGGFRRGFGRGRGRGGFKR
jgi:hypothetical protein